MGKIVYSGVVVKMSWLVSAHIDWFCYTITGGRGAPDWHAKHACREGPVGVPRAFPGLENFAILHHKILKILASEANSLLCLASIVRQISGTLISLVRSFMHRNNIDNNEMNNSD